MKLEELSRLLRDVDPAVVLVAESVLVRVVQNISGLNWTVWRVPHSRCLLLDRPTLYKHIEQEELYPLDSHPPETVLLLERPTAEQLGWKTPDLLARYWRLLFHVSAHRELEQRLAGVGAAGLRERVEQLGPAAFEEARNVLTQDGLLTAKADDRATYIELAAYFFELKYFNHNLLPVCFPSLPPMLVVEAIFARDLDGAKLFERTRLPGAPNPAPKTDDQSDESHDYYYRLTRQATRLALATDMVGAAILYTKAARVAPADLTGPAQEEARKQINALVDRLRDALGLTEPDAQPWRRVLSTLLDKADQGARPVEASLLYDLQRACHEHAEPIYALDVAEWLRSGGRRPIKRELKKQKFVRVPTQLRNAAKRLTAARLNDADRQTLSTLLREAQNRAENQLRKEFRPVLTAALQDAGLQPASLPERAALDKSVEELLDRISASGYLSFGDVRDAIARGQMKLPDLAGPQEFFRGDPLLRLDRRLANQLDGVYRRAESYTRGLERVTAFNFGTAAGRWIARNVTLPFGAAFLTGEFIWLLVFERWSKVSQPQVSQPQVSQPQVSQPQEGLPEAGLPEAGLPFFGGWNAAWWFHAAWVGFGLFLLIAIRSARVRRGLASVARGAYWAARYVCCDLPTQLWATPWVRAIVASVPVQLTINYGLKPALLSALLFTAFRRELWDSGWAARIITVVACAFAVNTRLGRAVQELLLETSRSVLNVFRSAPAVLRWINDLFGEMLDAVEWVLARTEDWLRLRGRSGPFAIAIRAVAGVVWMPFAFLLRFYTVVLLEPMLNPIKLPLSILFAKFIYPLLLLLPNVLVKDENSLLGYSSPLVAQLSDYLSEPGAWLLVMGTLWLLPDACTFLFWEMRENWRLYRANRPSALRPVMVGAHGETMKGLLHYGFHSGTVPRLFARLRAAERLAARTDNWRDSRTHRDALRAVEEAVRRFVTRDLVAVLNPSPAWVGPRLAVGQVELGTNRIRVELVPEEPGRPAWLEWEDRSGWLVAGWAEPGFLTHLEPAAARAMENALAYLYKRSGVDIVREQLRAELPAAAHYDIAAAGLLVWYGSRETTPILYDLADPVAELRPRNPVDLKPTAGPTRKADRILFDRVSLAWPQWMDVWQLDPTRQPRFGPPGWNLVLLPAQAETAPEPPPLVEANGVLHAVEQSPRVGVDASSESMGLPTAQDEPSPG